MTSRDKTSALEAEESADEAGTTYPAVPHLFTVYPPIVDDLITETSEAQNATIAECLPHLTLSDTDHLDSNTFGIPRLQRMKHVRFLTSAVESTYPPQFVSMDASRPWILYWSLAGLYMLGEDVSKYRDAVISTFTPMQHPEGGFGGGHGQLAHSAASYAAILSLVLVGGTEALDMVDRKAMWHWLGRMKQRDGGFTVCQGGEEDIRGAYCSMTIHSLLNLPIELPPESPARVNGDETFLTKLTVWISKCQTYEGGIAASPNNEAHGAYAFCALACLSILEAPSKIIPRCLDVHALLAWLSARQHAPEGGFTGRTNKLVDGCYSHWVGGCWSLLEASLGLTLTDLWSRDGLIRYILSCCQGKRGGLRDKPSKNPDAYHTCYNLAGLSGAQNIFEFVDEERFEGTPLTAGYGWEVAKQADVPCDDSDRVKFVHPVFVVPIDNALVCRRYFEDKLGF